MFQAMWFTYLDDDWLYHSYFVCRYYKSDKDVLVDKELQGFANEISIDGTTPPYGGRGKVRFNSIIHTRNLS